MQPPRDCSAGKSIKSYLPQCLVTHLTSNFIILVLGVMHMVKLVHKKLFRHIWVCNQGVLRGCCYDSVINVNGLGGQDWLISIKRRPYTFPHTIWMGFLWLWFSTFFHSGVWTQSFYMFNTWNMTKDSFSFDLTSCS